MGHHILSELELNRIAIACVCCRCLLLGSAERIRTKGEQYYSEVIMQGWIQEFEIGGVLRATL